MNVGSLFLLPVAIASAIVAFERQDRRSVVFAGLMAATTPLTHHPSFIAYVLVVGTIGLYFLLHSPERMTVLRTSLVMAAIGALLSLPAHIPFLTSFFWQYYSSTGAGIRDFPQLAEIVGLSYFDYMRYGPTGSPVEASPLALVVTIATLLVAALGVLAADPKRRTLFAAMAGIGIVYVLALRFVLNHPYGYLKGVTLFVFMLIAFVIAGLVWLWQSAVRIRKWQTITVRVLVLIFVAMYLVLSWSSLNSIIARYGQQPAYFDQDALRLAELPALLTPAASVYVPGNGNIPPVFMGFAAYFLRDHPVYGDVHTGYFPYTNSPPATGYGYALLPQGTDPASQGLGNWGAVWANSMAKILAPMPMPAHVASANLAERVRFLGYDLTATEARLPTVHPGDRLQLTLFWQALAPMSDGYSVFVHLVDSTGTMHGGVDREPLRGGFPTNRWAVGEQVQDTYELAVPADAQPGRYAIEVGMYLRPALIHLPVIDATGAQSDRIVIPLKVSVTTTASPRHVVGANLGGEVTLIGYDLPKTKLKPGEQLDLTLVWQAQRAIEHDYTVFVHVLDSTGRVVAQRDNQPQSGRYPTSIWDVGERVADRYGIILLPNLPRGEYYIEVGLYLLQTGERLPVLNTAGQPQGDHVLFSPITIE
jgi:hypothetical protein